MLLWSLDICISFLDKTIGLLPLTISLQRPDSHGLFKKKVERSIFNVRLEFLLPPLPITVAPENCLL